MVGRGGCQNAVNVLDMYADLGCRIFVPDARFVVLRLDRDCGPARTWFWGSRYNALANALDSKGCQLRPETLSVGGRKERL